MRLAVIFGGPRKLSAWLTEIWTGCRAYHVAWVDEAAGQMWDMHLIRRRRTWPHYPEDQVLLFEAPATVTREYLESKLESDDNRYGVLDYCLFALRRCSISSAARRRTRAG